MRLWPFWALVLGASTLVWVTLRFWRSEGRLSPWTCISTCPHRDEPWAQLALHCIHTLLPKSSFGLDDLMVYLAEAKSPLQNLNDYSPARKNAWCENHGDISFNLYYGVKGYKYVKRVSPDFLRRQWGVWIGNVSLEGKVPLRLLGKNCVLSFSAGFASKHCFKKRSMTEKGMARGFTVREGLGFPFSKADTASSTRNQLNIRTDL